MFLKLAKFEFVYLRSQRSFYLALLLLFLMPFLSVLSVGIQFGSAVNANLNSPYNITNLMLMMSMLSLFMVAVFVGDSAIRDTVHKMEGFMLAAPIPKNAFLWGRLLGALGICIAVFAVVPLGILLASFWPTLDSSLLGETRLLPYLWIYLIFVIPNFVFCAVVFYSCALKMRSMMGVYLAAVAFFVLYELSSSLLNTLDLRHLSALLDPLGLTAFFETTQYWTPFERNTKVVSLEGDVLYNRLLWLGVSAVLVVFIQRRFDLRKPTHTDKNMFKADNQKIDKTAPPSNVEMPIVRQSNGIERKRFIARTRFEMGRIIKSLPFVILCFMPLVSLLSIQISTMEGVASWPLTHEMVSKISGVFYPTLLIIITYYAGEIVWNERQTGMADIMDATVTRNTSFYFPKVIALCSIVACLMLISVVLTVGNQIAAGYYEFEWGLYFSLLMIKTVIPTIMLTILAVLIQIVSPNKYLGMLIFFTVWNALAGLSYLGVAHNLWFFASIPSFDYSDLNGYGHFAETTFWYNLYWTGATLVLIALGSGLWRRGVEYKIKYRFSLLSSNMGKSGWFTIVAGGGLVLGCGTFIYFNTVMLNDFVSRGERLNRQQAYENQYKVYENLDLPIITAVKADVDFYPAWRKVKVKGQYVIENTHAQAMKKVLVHWDSGNFSRFDMWLDDAFDEAVLDEQFGLTWVHFNPPLAPGAKTTLNFAFSRGNGGFVDRDSDVRLVHNGSYVTNRHLFPQFGYQADYEISDPTERQERGLPVKPGIAKLEDIPQHYFSATGKDAHFVDVDLTVSTSAEQTAIAPGYLHKQWTVDGRRYFHYKTDQPIVNLYALMSGRYEVEKVDHNGVSIEVYYHPAHDKNIEAMITAVKGSLNYYAEQFSPYPYRQLRIIEVPHYRGSAQGFANTIPYAENIGFTADLRDSKHINIVYFAVAHEVAHQWWANQVMPAQVEGWKVITETLAEYSAFMVVEKTLGAVHLRSFLHRSLDGYLQGRGSQMIEELPLYRSSNQAHVHYRKGGLVMYALRDRIGEAQVNRALRKFLEKYKYAYRPYPTTLDLLAIIKAEAPVADYGFIDDLFKKITVFDLKMKLATATQLADGGYQLKLTVEANKYYADGFGDQTAVDFEDAFDIGAFAGHPDEAATLYLGKHRMHNGENVVTLKLDTLPEYVGVDPYIKMIDRDSEDNIMPVGLSAADQP